MNWNAVDENFPPPTDEPLLCFCPRWSDIGYQVATFNGKKFMYEDQPNDNFDMHVERWALFFKVE